MKALANKSIIGLIAVFILSTKIIFASDSCNCPPPGNPGGDHPDDTSSYSTTTSTTDEDTSPKDTISTGLLTNGYFDKTYSYLFSTGRETKFITPEAFSPEFLKEAKVLLIPTGGLHNLDTPLFRAMLDEYVKSSGTIIVFAQQHGYDFDILPAPLNPNTMEKESVRGYGWTEDQSCQFSSSYIDIWHQVLSGQNKSAPSINVDGYLTSYPENATVLFRRTANEQPSSIIYPYGNGYVIATAFYTDFAFATGQASVEEKALIRDIITWAKSPASLPEISPGGTVLVPVSVTNNASIEGESIEATSVRFLIYNPDRTTLLTEQTANISIFTGQSATISVSYTSTSTLALGIYHIDYELYDSNGIIIQPQAETVSGRFVVSNPPLVGYEGKEITFSIQSESERFLIDTPATFKINIWNNTDIERTITAYTFNTGGDRQSGSVTIPSKSMGTMEFTSIIKYRWGRFRVSFFDETSGGLRKPLGGTFRGWYGIIPSASLNVTTDKTLYAKGETVSINTSLKNTTELNTDWKADIKIKVTDSQNTTLFEDTKTEVFSYNESTSLFSSFTLPATLNIGTYIVWVDVWYGARRISTAYTKFELPQSQISVMINLPPAFKEGNNTVSFILNNPGKISVYSGILDLSLKDPEGIVAYSGSQPFAIAGGETKTLDIPILIPPIKLGTYTLIYTQSDETRTGKPTSIIIPSTTTIALSLDKPSYRVRETANLTVNLTNTGKFNLENASFTVSVPDVNYINTQTISLITANSQHLTYTIPIPETITAGQHNINVTMTLPSGGLISQGFSFMVSEPSVTIIYSGPRTLTVEDTINLTVENTGGVDANSIIEIKLRSGYDAFHVYRNTINDTIQAGDSKIYSFQIPLQAKGDRYLLNAKISGEFVRTFLLSEIIDISGITAGLSVKTDKDVYLFTENITALSQIANKAYTIDNANLHLQIVNRCSWEGASYHISIWDGTNWVERGVLRYPNTLNTKLIDLSAYLPDSLGEYKVRIRHDGIYDARIDYITLMADGVSYVPASAISLTTNNDILGTISSADSWTAYALNNEIEIAWTGVPASTNKILLMRAKEGSNYSPCQEKTYWQTDIPITQAANTTINFSYIVSPLYESGQFYLQGTLTSRTGQIIAQAEYPFNIIYGDIALCFRTDMAIYRPGETVTITGNIVNLAAIEASGITVEIRDNNWSTIYTGTFNIPANGAQAFTFTTTAMATGVYQLYGEASQNASYLTSVTDIYEVAAPALTATATAPSVVGRTPFELGITIINTGKVPSTVQLSASGGSLSDTQSITLQQNETKLIQYTQSISQDTTYTINITGDFNQANTIPVIYGEGATVALNTQTIYPEGRIAIPVTITNTGQLDESLTVDFSLQPSTIIQTRTYYIPVGTSTASDTLYFDVIEGDYQLSAISYQPPASANSNFSVKKENKVEMTVSIGSQTNGLIPVTVNLTNLGYNSIEVNLQYTLVSSQGTGVWSGEQGVSQLSPCVETQAEVCGYQLIFNINPSSFEPGNYILQIELLNNSNQQLAVHSSSFSVLGVTFNITELPSYQTFYPGQEATFTFRVKNAGNQEGAYDLNFKSYDLIDETQREWLKSGEEKVINFSFMMPEDLEEKDYFADYELKAVNGQQSSVKGQVKYHLAGINLNVNATLDKQTYKEGETARLTIVVSQQAGVGSQNLFARINYTGYENQQSFTLNGSQSLTFDIPLSKITGEKLFYGIYYESGRSIYLNSLYIYKAGEVITITTNKQVYNLSETVVVTVTSLQSGMLTLTAPNYTETFAFTGTSTKSFTLQSTMAAGTYFINYQFTVDGSQFTGRHPFDVAGIQIKVKEATLDKGKYASTDTLKLRLLIESNQNIPATLKAWIVDPEEKYTAAGESDIVLSSTEPLLVTHHSSLVTAVSGIHRFVYGIYTGDLLLASGSEAFDVGDAVLLSISTDKVDYPSGNEAVIVTASMYGTFDSNLVIQLDGNTVKEQTVSLGGFSTLNSELRTITPGLHTLKGILTAGGLRSTKEASFIYGSGLPDLTIAISTQKFEVIKDNTIEITATVTNQGKTSSDATTIALYGGDSIIETKPVNTLDPGESQELTFILNVLGKAGEHTIKAVVDPEDRVIEFKEDNNIVTLTITIPAISINISTDKEIYTIGSKVNIKTTLTNLTSQTTYSNLILETKVSDSIGTIAFVEQKSVPVVQPINSVTVDKLWDTKGLAEGNYTITQTVISDSQSITQSSKIITLQKSPGFEITIDTTSQRIKQGEKARYTTHIEPLEGFNSVINLSIAGLPSGTSVLFEPGSLIPPGDIIITIITSGGTPANSHNLTFIAEGGEIRQEVVLVLDVSGFGLEVNPSTQVVTQLGTASYTLKLTSLNNYGGEVGLRIDGEQNGMRAKLGAETTLVPNTISLTIETSKYLRPGTYSLTTIATDGLVEKRANITLTVESNPEISFGIITTPGPGPKNPSTVSVFTKDMQLIRIFTAFDTKYGANAVMADIDGDGYDEIIVAPGPDPKAVAKIKVYRRDGSFLFEQKIFEEKYGLTLASGDIDEDWKDEVIVGMGPDPKNPSRIKVLKYDSGRFIDTGIDFMAFDSLKYGVNVVLGDIDGDAFPEIIAGAGPGPKNPSWLRAFKVDTSKGVGKWMISSIAIDLILDGSLYGINISSGDIDGDSIDEIITGSGPDSKNEATVKIIMADGTLIGDFNAYDEKHQYGVNISSIDIDVNGTLEIITGSGPGPQNPALLRIFNTKAELLYEYLIYPEMDYGLKVSKGRTGER